MDFGATSLEGWCEHLEAEGFKSRTEDAVVSYMSKMASLVEAHGVNPDAAEGSPLSGEVSGCEHALRCVVQRAIRRRMTLDEWPRVLGKLRSIEGCGRKPGPTGVNELLLNWLLRVVREMPAAWACYCKRAEQGGALGPDDIRRQMSGSAAMSRLLDNNAGYKGLCVNCERASWALENVEGDLLLDGQGDFLLNFRGAWILLGGHQPHLTLNNWGVGGKRAVSLNGAKFYEGEPPQNDGVELGKATIVATWCFGISRVVCVGEGPVKCPGGTVAHSGDRQQGALDGMTSRMELGTANFFVNPPRFCGMVLRSKATELLLNCEAVDLLPQARVLVRPGCGSVANQRKAIKSAINASSLKLNRLKMRAQVAASGTGAECCRAAVAAVWDRVERDVESLRSGSTCLVGGAGHIVDGCTLQLLGIRLADIRGEHVLYLRGAVWRLNSDGREWRQSSQLVCRQIEAKHASPYITLNGPTDGRVARSGGTVRTFGVWESAFQVGYRRQDAQRRRDRMLLANSVAASDNDGGAPGRAVISNPSPERANGTRTLR